MSDFLDKLKKQVAKQGAVSGVDLSLAASLLANPSVSGALSSVKLLAKIKGVKAARATLVALIDTALDE